ncbi:MAG: 16S rRNA processing protein RimM [Acholeplasmatales bacterium]|nr:16S rRNA processing protein RimM [Acholeplasmatales bacterium]
MKFYKCGHIMTTHGIKGDLKVKPLTDFDRFYKGSKLYILHNDNYVEVKVKKASIFGNYYLVSFEGLEDINLVEKYHSDDIYVSELDRKNELEENEYYYSDLIGMNVINQNNESRGVVVEIREMPQAEYLVINYNNKKVLVPFINEFIVDVNEGIIVKEIEGLF